MENSPARKSSLSRLTSSVLEKVLGNSNIKKVAEGSDRGSNSGAVNITDHKDTDGGGKPATNRGSFFGSSGTGP